MFKISEFSKLSHVTVKTLRYYDRIGLLKPAEVDRFTNYRYYSARQLPRLNRILALKGLGLSLDEIGLLLEEDLPPKQIRGMLRPLRPGVGANERLPHLGLSRGRLDVGRVAGEPGRGVRGSRRTWAGGAPECGQEHRRAIAGWLRDGVEGEEEGVSGWRE